jgi:hypothetical protein
MGTRRIAVQLLALSAVISATSVAGVASAAGVGSRPGMCLQYATGSISIAAGGLASPRSYTASGTANDFSCAMPDPSIHSATEVWSQHGSVTCLTLGEAATGTDKVHWSNGRISVYAYTDHAAGTVDDTQGVVIRGEFKGMRVHFVGAANMAPSDPISSIVGVAKACGLQQAVTDVPLLYVGAGAFL